MKLAVGKFLGIAPKIPPRFLPNEMAQVALDVEASGTSVKPLRDPSAAHTTLTKSGTLQTLYRFGQDLKSSTQHWLSWAADVDVCRGQISGDTAEWTFYTGDGFPKATNSRMVGSGGSLPAGYRRLGIPGPTTALGVSAAVPNTEKRPASFTVSAASIAALNKAYGVEASVDGGRTWARTGPLSSLTASVVAASLKALPGLTARESGGTVIVETLATGPGAAMALRWGAAAGQMISVTGSSNAADLGEPETRVYTYTWVNIEDGLSMESAAAPPSATVDVYAGGTVTLSGFGSPPSDSGVRVTRKRIYRATNGTYLFVAEIPASQQGFVDRVEAEALGETLPSLTWAMPPATLRGLINLPNGIMAGFSGRDVYFCEPYRPYAWPVEYMQSIDYPVVGLGRVDTTLVVLTTGTPYLIQGSAPDVMTVVKSNLEQSCVAKRSIVSMEGAVFYVSPDGLVKLASNGGSLVTASILSRADWQALDPESLFAVGHDGKYIAFGPKGGFVYDTREEAFYRHTLTGITAGYAELQSDTLYLLDTNKKVTSWGGGAARRGVWRSKRFTLPQITGFSCMQVEAEEYPTPPEKPAPTDPTVYPIVCRVYADQKRVLAHTVSSRAPFRLPAVQAREWEFELDVVSEIFNVVIAQSMSEIASG